MAQEKTKFEEYTRENLAAKLEATIKTTYHRDVTHDDDYCLMFQFSSRRSIEVAVRPSENNPMLFRLDAYIFDPSLTQNPTEDNWDGMSVVEAWQFSAGRFVADLGLASLNGGLAAVYIEILFDFTDLHVAAEVLMETAGLVDMYTR